MASTRTTRFPMDIVWLIRGSSEASRCLPGCPSHRWVEVFETGVGRSVPVPAVVGDVPSVALSPDGRKLWVCSPRSDQRPRSIVGPPTDLTTFLASFDRKLTESS